MLNKFRIFIYSFQCLAVRYRSNGNQLVARSPSGVSPQMLFNALIWLTNFNQSKDSILWKLIEFNMFLFCYLWQAKTCTRYNSCCWNYYARNIIPFWNAQNRPKIHKLLWIKNGLLINETFLYFLVTLTEYNFLFNKKALDYLQQL